MKERDFLNWVLDVAKIYRWRWWHVPAPTVWSSKKGAFVPSSSGAGLPDLILLHDDPPTLIFAELKGETGQLSEEQREFLQLARAVADWTPRPHRRMNTYVWKPGLEDHIEFILKTRVLT